MAAISCMKFSSNQQHLLAVVEGHIFVMDTFDGREVVTWKTGMKAGAPAMEASFSADGLYAISGLLLFHSFLCHLSCMGLTAWPLSLA
jgi:hypothetical protein